jgi:hypothetical protein
MRLEKLLKDKPAQTMNDKINMKSSTPTPAAFLLPANIF